MKNKITNTVSRQTIQHLADNMREADVQEVWASDRHTPMEALEQGVLLSDMVWVAIVEGIPAAIGGVVPLPTDFHPRAGVCWMLATDRLKLQPYWFLEESKQTLKDMLSEYDYLSNFVDARNVVSLSWLQWLGFKAMPEAPYGAEQRMFVQVIKEA